MARAMAAAAACFNFPQALHGQESVPRSGTAALGRAESGTTAEVDCTPRAHWDRLQRENRPNIPSMARRAIMTLMMRKTLPDTTACGEGQGGGE